MGARLGISFNIAAAILAVGLAAAEPTKPDATAPPPLAEPFSFEAFGVFRNMMLRGDFTAKVAIGAVMSRQPSTASAQFLGRAAKSPSPMES